MCKIVALYILSLYSGIASGKADAPEKNVSNLPGKLMLACLHVHFSFFFLIPPLTIFVKNIQVSFRSTASYLEDCENLLQYPHHKVVKTLGGLLTSSGLCCVA